MLLKSLFPVLAFTSIALMQQSCRAEPNHEVISRLEQILQIREAQLREENLLEELGRSDIGRMGSLKTAAIETRIEIAEELEDDEAVIKHLEQIIKIYENLIQRMDALTAEELRTTDDRSLLTIAKLETEVRLLRLKQD